MNDQQFLDRIKEKGFNLTEAQWKAVVHDKGPLLLLAVPGAGKTTVLTLRLVYLILVKHVTPESILCLTFGRAAAKEMQDRFTNNFSGQISGNIHFSTIHSHAFEVARETFRQQRRGYQIIENQTGAVSKTGVLRRLYEQINRSALTNESLEELQNAICFVKNAMLSPEKLKNVGIDNFVTLYKDYEKYKLMHEPQLLDYDDMLSIAYATLMEDPQMLAKYQQRYHYILTDESQDTSLIQHKIIELIAQPKGNLFVVGDDDQSIFGFRASDPKYLLNFNKVYDQAEVLRLERNFRSTPEIVTISREFIRMNQLRYDKDMVTENVTGDPVQVKIFKHDQEQNAFILSELKKSRDVSKSAVLYRNNFSVISLADELDRGGVSFYIRDSNKDRFFGHWVVNDILNFLRFSYSDKCDKSVAILEKIRTKVSPTISKVQIDYLYSLRIERSIFDILSKQLEVNKRLKLDYLKLKEQFYSLNKLSPGKAIRYIRNDLGYNKVIERISKDLGFSKEHLTSILNLIETIANRETSILEFANRLMYLEEKIKTSYRNKGTKAVTLSTIHSAKGLEWESVYVVDLLQGIIPDYGAVENAENKKPKELEEERRLFYVAMTRSKKHLTLCTMKEYQRQTAMISQFVNEVQLLLQGKNPLEIKQELDKQVDSWSEGLVVIHQTFGEGVITKIQNNHFIILFKNGSERMLMKDICEKQKLLKPK